MVDHEQEFLYDPDDPLAEYEWEVPAGVDFLTIWVCGGGTYSEELSEGSTPEFGWVTFAEVNPGDTLTVVLGGAAGISNGGTNGGGEGGGGYLAPSGVRGYGGGGYTSITRNALPWVVAGGTAGVAASPYVSNQNDPGTFTHGSIPGAGATPRAPYNGSEQRPAYSSLDLWLSGDAGDLIDGGDGKFLEHDSKSYGSGGGGAGWGGGAGGGIGVYTDLLAGGQGAVPYNGRHGGSLLPEPPEGLEPSVWSVPGSAVYPTEYGGHGYAKIISVSGSTLESAGFDVGTLRF